jgi:hypothetical protein
MEDFNLIFQNETSKIALIQAPNGKYLRTLANGDLRADVSSVDLKKSSTWTGSLAFLIQDVVHQLT